MTMRIMISDKQTEELDVLGIRLTNLRSYAHAVDSIVGRIQRAQKTFCVAINPEKIYRAQSDPALRALMDSADVHICDGIGAKMAARVLHGTRVGRITGVQLFFRLMARAEQTGLGVFLLGASAESNKGACKKLCEIHPRLRIVGTQDGYFENDEEVVRRINTSGADMLFVAMGSPRQEEWIVQHRGTIKAPYCMGIGGTLDVVSGRVTWAPKIFRKTGTEWLYRLVTEPRRWKRQLVLPRFALLILKARVLPSRYQRQPAIQHEPIPLAGCEIGSNKCHSGSDGNSCAEGNDVSESIR